MRFRFHTVDNGGQDLVFLLNEVLINLAVLRLADLLDDHLLGRLCRHPAEIGGRHLGFDDVLLLIVRLDLSCLFKGDLGCIILDLEDNRLPCIQMHGAAYPVEFHPHIGVGRHHPVLLIEVVLVCTFERLFNRGKQNFLANILFLCQHGNGFNHFLISVFIKHIRSLPF